MTTPICVDCKTEQDPRRAWAEVTGWELKRPGGGTNHVALRERTGRVLCNACMTLRRQGINRGQDSLL